MTRIDLPVDLGLLVPNQEPTPLAGRLTWDATAPTDIFLTIHRGPYPDVAWLIGRDLLAAALHGHAGDGDIHIRPHRAEAHMLRIDLSSPSGKASLIVDRATVGDFLRSTWLTVSVDQERAVLWAAMDDFDWAAERVADDAGETL